MANNIELKEKESFTHPHLKIIMENVYKRHSSEKIFVGDLKAGDLIEVKTQNTHYKLKVIEPETDLVEAVSDGDYLYSPKKMRVLGLIAKGFSLFLEAAQRNSKGLVETINTSSVREINVNGRDPFGKMLCQANGTKCNVCGGQFAEGEDICSLGHHQIGKYY